MNKKIQIGVIGPAGPEEYPNQKPNKKIYEVAEKVGYLLAKKGVVVITGGKSGVMETAAKGAKKAKGITVGVIKGKKRLSSNKYIDVEVLTGMEADGMDELNIVMMCDGLIAIGGGAGTLQEIVLAYRNKKPVVFIDKMGGIIERLPNPLDEREKNLFIATKSPEEAVKTILKNV